GAMVCGGMGLTERMERFCDELRGERERRQVSIETICDLTKVASRHLLALEAGEYGALPGGVFRKGIVRSYLGALGLEEDHWIQRFETSLRESGAAATEADRKSTRLNSSHSQISYAVFCLKKKKKNTKKHHVYNQIRLSSIH